MRIIEIQPLSNGAHRNQNTSGTISIPEGWAKIPHDMPVPSTFPFVEVTAEDGIVVSMTEGVIPVIEESTPAPSQLDRIESQVAYTAVMTNTLLEEETDNAGTE